MIRLLVAASSLFWAIGIAGAAVDANTASRAELESIRGIGPATSARIVEERRRQPFRDPQDLVQRIKGIGENRMRKMVAAGLTVGGSAVLVSAGGKTATTHRLGSVVELQSPPPPSCAGEDRPLARAGTAGGSPARRGTGAPGTDDSRAR